MFAKNGVIVPDKSKNSTRFIKEIALRQVDAPCLYFGDTLAPAWPEPYSRNLPWNILCLP